MIDDGAAMDRYEKMLPFLNMVFGAHEIDRRQSKSGASHFHVVVSLDTSMDAAHRCVLQAALGSDPKREIMAVLLLRLGDQEPSSLFRQPRQEKAEAAA